MKSEEGLALYSSLLKRYWGYDSFRGIQQQIIESIGSGHDTLGLMPTGGGKSVAFQVPALAMEGVCIVVTPLIALMKDQVEHLRRRRIKAAAIYSGMTHEQILTTLENAVFGAVKLLYVSPERLSSQLFITKVKHMKVSFVTVDEAHCISQWGYDFRPSYLQIARIRHELPGVPMLALTATATPLVANDIMERLEFDEKRLYQMSFERKNLAYQVYYADDKLQQLIHLLEINPGSAIVYARSRQRTRATAERLVAAGLSATFFHAGLDHATKDQRQRDWQEGRTRVIVATNAFGMGIDKADVRLVVHIDCPDSIEAYFQEAGRAGRDGKPALAVLLYSKADHNKLEKRIADTFPPKDYVKQVYEHLAYYYQVATGAGYNAIFEFNMMDFCVRFRHFPIHVDASLKILDRAGYIEYIEEQENQARVKFTISRDEFYQLRNLTPTEDSVVTALMRNYGGLFVDYCYIDEALIASQTNLSLQQLYLTLKALGASRVLNFIPQKKTPYIRYTQRREDKEHLQLMPEVYEQRKQQYIDRVRAIEEYAANDQVCRSRQLLRYFGETVSHDCHQCDVCLDHEGRQSSNDDTIEATVDDIRQLLSDGAAHHVTELVHVPHAMKLIDSALEQMLEEEHVVQRNGFLMLAK